MTEEPAMQLWQLVSSRAGRDEGQAYLVADIGQEDGFVRLVDGDKRRLEAPKRKNVRHLVLHPVIAGELAQKAAAGMAVRNAEVREALRRLVEEVMPGSAKE
jgi:large subunit ribosomal protein L14e